MSTASEIIGGGLAFVIAGAILMNYISNQASGGIETANLRIVGGNVSYAVANMSDREGDIVTEVRQGDFAWVCQHVFRMPAGGTINELSFHCPQVDSAPEGAVFSVRAKWATSSDLALARRIEIR